MNEENNSKLEELKATVKDSSEVEDTESELENALERESEQEPEKDGYVETTEVDKKAKTFGHVSKEDWERQGRDPNKWKSPEQFVEFGDSYSKLKPHIETLKKEISKRDAALDTIIEHINEVKQKEYLRGKAEVEARLQQAKEMGDINAVENLTRHKTELEYQEQRTQQSTKLQQQQQAEAAFIERNRHWYNEQHIDLVQRAQQAAVEIQSFYPNSSYEEVTKKVEARMRFEYPDLVENGRNVSRPNVPQSRSNVTKSAMESMPDNDDRIYRTLSADQKAEYNHVKRLVERVPGIKYSLKEFVEKSKQLKQ